MKKTFWLSLVVGLALVPAVAGAVTAYDTSLLFRQLQIISNHVNNIRDSDSINSVVSPKNTGLIKSIDSHVVGKTVQFSQNVTKIEDVSADSVRISGTFTAQGQDGKRSWKNQGKDFYVFARDKQTAKWFLTDTDFYQRIGVDSQASKQAATTTWIVIIILAGLALLGWRFREPLQPWVKRLSAMRFGRPPRRHHPPRIVQRSVEPEHEPVAPVHHPPAEPAPAAEPLEHRQITPDLPVRPVAPPDPARTIDLRQHQEEDEE